MKGPWRTSAGGVDFAKLYAELGVAPDCGLDRFKQAYRRRVAGLHPDRPGSRGAGLGRAYNRLVGGDWTSTGATPGCRAALATPWPANIGRS